MYKAELKALVREPSVEFLPKEHLYKNKNTGEYYTGTTTISDAWDKSYFLGPWYAKEMAEHILKAPFDSVMKMTPRQFEDFIVEAKGAAKRKGEKAKNDGTEAHDWIEQYIAAKINDTLDPPPTPTNPEALNAINAFCAWAKTQNIQWLASEEVVASDQHRVAGKLDAIAIISGIPTLVDFKTSGQLSASYLLQCAGYDLMLSEMGFSVRQYLIVRIPKDGGAVETLTVSDMEEIKFLNETFLHQREAHKYYVYAETKLKDQQTNKIKVDTKPEKSKVAKRKVAA